MMSVSVVVVSLCCELAFEALVDYFALDVEMANGVDLNRFWSMWRKNAPAYLGRAVCDGMLATVITMWAFKLHPVAIFCTSPTDTCSCKGAGFEIFAPFCNGTAVAGNGTVVLNASRSSALVEDAQSQYIGVFDDLGNSAVFIFVSVSTAIIIVVVFVVVRFVIALAKVGDEKAVVERRNKELLEANIKIQSELMLTKLDRKQAAMVKAHAKGIEDHVPSFFVIDWRELTFEGRLGSGSFGDCFRGRKGGRPVAIKRMRAGLVDKNGFKSFSKEVIVLSQLDHVNIVTFIGYSKDPFLLIVMEFVSGGTLSDFVEAQDSAEPPAPDTLLNILVGSAKGLEYLHGREPMPILHRDIKSENILITDKLEPRIADLGEARAMAEDRAMTMVGTNGYTAPEVLRGEHYGTEADVFSFGIVMCELLTLRAPYSDMLKSEDGTVVMSWDQVAKLSAQKEDSLRPTLPDLMQADVRRLIRDCWASDAALRPCFSVILLRLGHIIHAENMRSKSSSSREAKRAREFTLQLSRRVVNLLSHYQAEEALAVVAPHCTATAKDGTINEILQNGGKGPACVKNLGWLLFGGMEEGEEITVEPLLDDDVTLDLAKSCAMIRINFSVRGPKKRHQWTSRDEREFDGLQKALAEAESALATSGTETMEKAISRSANRRRVKSAVKKRRQQSKKRSRSHGNDTFANFVKAARYVRGLGARTTHPGAKLRLVGLLLQAQHGDCTRGEGGTAQVLGLAGLLGSALTLQTLKLKAWASEKGKSREDAMKEYVDFLTSFAPRWKVAHLLRAKQSLEDTKPRAMMWVLKVEFKQGSFITSIEVMQSSNGAGARLFSEEGVAMNTRKPEKENAEREQELDPFLAGFPRDLRTEDALEKEYKTIEEQRASLLSKMRNIVQSVEDQSEGWELLGKTSAPRVEDEDQLDIFARAVEWSPAPQLLSVAETSMELKDLFNDIKVGVALAAKRGGGVAGTAEKLAALNKVAKTYAKAESYLFAHETEKALLCICYKVFPLPW